MHLKRHPAQAPAYAESVVCNCGGRIWADGRELVSCIRCGKRWQFDRQLIKRRKAVEKVLRRCYK